jgi:beta-N-acetylglucosaminidase
MRKKLLAFLTAFVLMLSIMPNAKAADELTGLTLEDEMRAMLAQGIIKGYSDGTVRPKDDVTREQFAAFIARAMDLPESVPTFIDVNKSSALVGAIGAVQQAGIMKGTLDLKFQPTKKISREEMAITMGRVITMKKLEIQNPVQVIIADEKDFFSSEGRLSAQTVASAQIMNGYVVNKEQSTFNFKPKDISKRDQVSAVIYRYLELVAAQTTPEPEPGTPPPVDPTIFQVASINNGALVKTATIYKTYDAALAAFNATSITAIYKGNDIIKVKSGLAFAADETSNVVDTATIYSSSSLTTQLTYTTEGREMKYIGSGPDYVIVQVGGSQGYVKHKEVDLTPSQLVTGRDRYVKNGSSMLNHYVYNHVTKRSDFYTVGPAPTFMTSFVDYYSYDGVQFYSKSNLTDLKGTFYPYFQFQSVRQPSQYTAAELDSYITAVLAERQATGISRYSQATTTSKLIGLGAYLKEMETTHRVNAMFILAAAIHESDYGISGNSITKNNIFGIKVFDSSPELGEKYAKPQDSVLAFVTRYINANYGPQTGAYAKGMVPGNKSVGFNVHYASDPQWGSKIAGHMYKIDSFLGNKDYMQANLAVTNQTGVVNARYTPVVSGSTLAFTYKSKDIGINKIFGYPLVILEEANGSDGYLWYKVLSDQVTPVDPVWIRSDIVNKISY